MMHAFLRHKTFPIKYNYGQECLSQKTHNQTNNMFVVT